MKVVIKFVNSPIWSKELKTLMEDILTAGEKSQWKRLRRLKGRLFDFNDVVLRALLILNGKLGCTVGEVEYWNKTVEMVRTPIGLGEYDREKNVTYVEWILR
jgi:hypothetical protein